MSEETIVYGQVDNDNQTVEIRGGEGNDSKVEALMQKIAVLEQEKGELVRENEVVKERLEKLKVAIEESQKEKAELKSEIEKYAADSKALKSIAARAAELETEVSRLQHDLVSALSEGKEANAEVSELKGLVSELRRSDSEKGNMVEVLEKERNLLLQRMEKDVQGANESKAVSESLIRKLEKKIEALEVRESGLKIEKVRIEEETRAKLEEKESQIRNFKMLFDESQSVIVRNKSEMERANKEKEELEIVKNDLEALLKKSERKVKEMEHKMGQLHTELEASEKMISGLKEKALDGINGKGVVVDRAKVLDEEKRLSGLKLEWPLMAVSASAVAAVTIFYLYHSKKR